MFIDEDVLATVVKGLNRQSAAGTSCVPTSSVSREQHRGHKAPTAFRKDDDVGDVLPRCSPIPERGTTRRNSQEGVNTTISTQLTARALQPLRPFQSAALPRSRLRPRCRRTLRREELKEWTVWTFLDVATPSAPCGCSTHPSDTPRQPPTWLCKSKHANTNTIVSRNNSA